MPFVVDTEARKFTATVEQVATFPGAPHLSTRSLTSLETRWTNARGRHKGHWGDWKKNIANGFCATTDLSGSETIINGKPGQYFVVRKELLADGQYRTNVIYRGSGNFIALGSPTAFDVSGTAARNQSLSMFYSQLAATEGAFKGLTFGGELPETLRMLRRPFSALRTGLGTYLGVVKKNAKRVNKQKRLAMVRDTWLETSYGWKPLISDCDSAIDAFYASKSILPLFKMVRGRGKEVESRPIGDFLFLNIAPGRVFGTTVDQSTIAYKHYGTYVSRSPGGQGNVHAYGFSPWEFVPTLWELIPYSFLVDYFSNVGKVLESYSYRNLGPSFCSEGSRRSRSRTITGKFDMSNNSSGIIHIGGGSGGSFYREHATYVRTPNIGVQMPTLSIKVPGKWFQWANMAALAAQSRSVSKVLTS